MNRYFVQEEYNDGFKRSVWLSVQNSAVLVDLIGFQSRSPGVRYAVYDASEFGRVKCLVRLPDLDDSRHIVFVDPETGEHKIDGYFRK